MFAFWKTWLAVTFVFMALLGYSTMWLIDTELWAWHQDAVARSLWGAPTFSPQTDAYRAWAMSIWGPTQAAWAVALFWVSVGPFARREPWAWWCIATSLLAWFLVDTPWSWIHGVWLNVGFNVAALMVVGVPLLATWRRFGGRGGVDLPPVFESNEC